MTTESAGSPSGRVATGAPVEAPGVDVLIVDDSPSDASLARSYLIGEDGFSVSIVTSLGDAVAVLGQRPTDCVLLDLSLPDAMGLEGLDALRQLVRETAIIVLTGRDDDAIGEAALRAGAQDFIAKNDVTPSILRRAVRHAVERHRQQVALEQAREALACEMALRHADAEAIRKERDFSAALLAAIREGYAFTVGGEIVDVNNELCSLTGFSRAELVGQRPPFSFWPATEIAQSGLGPEQLLASEVDVEVILSRKNGDLFQGALSSSPARNADGTILGYVTTIRDISAFRRREDALIEIASRDALTGLLNRRAVEVHLDQIDGGDGVTILDLDHFKLVNDNHGHAAGDDTLRTLAACITDVLRPDDWSGRLGGEEFIVVARHAHEIGAVAAITRLRRAWDACSPLATFSAGIAIHETGSEPRQTLARADEALYLAKRNGRNRTEVFPR